MRAHSLCFFFPLFCSLTLSPLTHTLSFRTARRYRHHDAERYLGDRSLEERKVPCDAEHPGQSRGICNGYGTCQCAPPFIGDDCSIRDCPDRCSEHGWCLVEFPVSRCVCEAGFNGLACENKQCLNNCSWPNGNCTAAGCKCNALRNPYDRDVPWLTFGGLDCSFGAYALLARSRACTCSRASFPPTSARAPPNHAMSLTRSRSLSLSHPHTLSARLPASHPPRAHVRSPAVDGRRRAARRVRAGIQRRDGDRGSARAWRVQIK